MYIKWHISITYNRCEVVRNGHIMTRTDLRQVYGRNVCTFPAILLKYNRCVVGRNGHIITRN